MAAINHKVRRATPTELAIKDAILADGGAKFRMLQEKWFPKIKDAYRGEEEKARRSHYGFSGAGDPCERALWFRWRWMDRNEFAFVDPEGDEKDHIRAAAMHRLVNRGHLEEARFLALLEMIGVHIEDPTEGQERVSLFNGHAASALDGVLYNVPCAPNEWVLGEFKTSNDKNFKDLKNHGVFKKKLAHYVQMQLCMAVRGIHKCLYMVVNKNDDEIYTEMVIFDPAFAAVEIAKIQRVMFSPSAPRKISNDPAWFECKFCDSHAFCQLKTWKPERNCRNCVAAVPDTSSANWRCTARPDQPVIPKDVIYVGCDSHREFTV